MNFIADKQTLEDLNMLGKYKQNSVYTIFNRVETTGGERLLMAMFQHPLTDPEEINKRSTIFQYFQDEAFDFPFTNAQFSSAENFLSNDSGKNRLAITTNLLKKKILRAFVRDEEYQLIESGLNRTIEVLNIFHDFIARLNSQNDDAPFYDKIQALKRIFDDGRIAWLQKERGASQWPLFKLIKYDYLLRNVLQVEMETVVKAIHQLDVYIAVGKTAGLKGFSYASALPKNDNVFKAAELSHPGMERPVCNPVFFHQNSNMIFLTGANMAGKSTFMKALGINIYLAHMGFPVAAKEMIFSIKDGIFSSINVPDNLNKGYSHFYAEVLRVKKVAEEVSSGKDLVVMFDELFKGTNVKDAYDATLAVTAAFSEYENCSFIISTHIIEAGEALQERYNNIQLLYLPTIMKGSTPTYTYKLQQGISSDRHGMMIIENEGILDML